MQLLSIKKTHDGGYGSDNKELDMWTSFANYYLDTLSIIKYSYNLCYINQNKIRIYSKKRPLINMLIKPNGLWPNNHKTSKGFKE